MSHTMGTHTGDGSEHTYSMNGKTSGADGGMEAPMAHTAKEKSNGGEPVPLAFEK